MLYEILEVQCFKGSFSPSMAISLLVSLLFNKPKMSQPFPPNITKCFSVWHCFHDNLYCMVSTLLSECVYLCVCVCVYVCVHVCLCERVKEKEAEYLSLKFLKAYHNSEGEIFLSWLMCISLSSQQTSQILLAWFYSSVFIFNISVWKVLCHYKMLLIDYTDKISESRPISHLRIRISPKWNHILTFPILIIFLKSLSGDSLIISQIINSIHLFITRKKE